ncbi:MAG: sigma-70 family RNA polymerase sigma factor [Planctomycetes bacterium]|nr:sigma-70 family RNA polymerase sigma factor [Planctomycetota bacterium]
MNEQPTEVLRQLTFRDVLHRVLEGDAGARDELFARLASETSEGALLLAIVRRLMPAGDRMRELVETRDLVQSALRSGWVNFAEFRGQTSGEFLGWIRTILRRKIIRALRELQDRRQREKGGLREDRLAARSIDLPLARLIRAEVRERVRRAVEELPEDQRVVIELRLKGLSAPEIAERLSLQPAAVRKRESRALARLREVMGGDKSAR